MARPPGGGGLWGGGRDGGAFIISAAAFLRRFSLFGTTKRHNPFDPLNKASGFRRSFSALLVPHEFCLRLLLKGHLPVAIAGLMLLVCPAA